MNKLPYITSGSSRNRAKAVCRTFSVAISGSFFGLCTAPAGDPTVRMNAGGSSQQSLRKAIGALKDSTTVGLANLNSDNKGLDVAIVKATNHDEVLPKEKHIRTIFDAVSASRPLDDIAYCIQGLAKRLSKTRNWTVALKTLIVIHRALREVDHTFHEQLINYNRGRGLMLNLSHFRDDSSPNAWDYSAWVRTYALYLEEHLECFRILKYDVEKGHSRTRELCTPDLLEQLPALQQLLFRLLACKPEGAAVYNSLIHYALSIVVGESVKLYVAITDGILNLVDKYFEMQRHDAIRALEIYRKAGDQAEKLSEFFEICRGLDFGRGQKFIKIEQPPASFISTMEDYVKEAPRGLVLQCIAKNDDLGTAPKEIDDQGTATKETDDQGTAPKEIATPEADSLIDLKQDIDVLEKSDASVASPEPPKSAAATQQITDLLGMVELTQGASELDEKNSLALAIITSENPSNSGNGLNLTYQTTNWELALVTAPSSNEAAVAESKLAGGLDKLTLDSLYDQAMTNRTNQNETYHMMQVTSNPFGEAVYHNHDPFYASSIVAPPTNVQMAAMAQQQILMQHQQPPPPMIGNDSSNPFGNPFVEQNVPSRPPENSYSGLI